MRFSSIPPVAFPFLAVGGLVLFLILAVTLTDHPLESWLRHYGVPAQHRPFGDLGVIAQGISDHDAGLPLYQYPPAKDQKIGGLFNYPRLWLYWRHLGLHPGTLIPWGVAIGILFIISAIRSAVPTNALEGCYLGILLCSPVCVLAIERGNSDLVVFSLLAWGVIVARPTIIRLMAIYISGAAKLYPLAAVGGLLVGIPTRQRLILIALLGVTSAVWIALTWSDWIAIAALTPQIAYLSYGSPVSWQLIAEQSEAHMPTASFKLLGWATALAVGFVSSLIALLPGHSHVKASSCAWRGFYAGAGIFIFTWLIGSSFQYRLVFLLFCLPALWAGRTLPDGIDRNLCLIALIGLPAYFWWDFFAGEGSLLVALTKQSLCIVLVITLAAFAARASRIGLNTTNSHVRGID